MKNKVIEAEHWYYSSTIGDKITAFMRLRTHEAELREYINKSSMPKNMRDYYNRSIDMLCDDNSKLSFPRITRDKLLTLCRMEKDRSVFVGGTMAIIKTVAHCYKKHDINKPRVDNAKRWE